MDATGVVPQGEGKQITAEWGWAYFRDVDTLDPKAITQHYADDGQFRFANQEPVQGIAAIETMLTTFFSAIQDMKHRNTGIWLGDNTAVFEAEVTFTRKDGSTIVIPASSIIRRRGDVVEDFRMIMDASPVMNQG